MINKQERKQVELLKKQLKLLLKLKKLYYQSSYVLLFDLIQELKEDLRLYGIDVG